MRQVGATQTHSGQVSSGAWRSLTGTITADRNLDAALRLKLFGVPTSAEIQVRASIDSAWHQANVPGEAGLSGGGTPVVVLAQADSLILYVPIGVVAAGEVVGAVILSSQTMPAEGQYVWELWDRSVMGALNTARPDEPTSGSPLQDAYYARLAAVAATANAVTATVSDTDVTLYKGMSYEGDQAVTLTATSYAGATPTTAVFRVLDRASYQATTTTTAALEIDATSVAVADETLTVVIDVAADDLDDLSPSPPRDTGNYRYQVIGTTATDETIVLFDGDLTVKKMIGTVAT